MYFVYTLNYNKSIHWKIYMHPSHHSSIIYNRLDMQGGQTS